VSKVFPYSRGRKSAKFVHLAGLMLLSQNPCQLSGYMVSLANELLTVSEPKHPGNGITAHCYPSMGTHLPGKTAFFRKG